jgi:hypothetical protein
LTADSAACLPGAGRTHRDLREHGQPSLKQAFVRLAFQLQRQRIAGVGDERERVRGINRRGDNTANLEEETSAVFFVVFGPDVRVFEIVFCASISVINSDLAAGSSSNYAHLR